MNNCKLVNVEVIAQALAEIWRWQGQAYVGPCDECPEGDDIYQAVEAIKREIFPIKTYQWSLNAGNAVCGIEKHLSRYDS